LQEHAQYFFGIADANVTLILNYTNLFSKKNWQNHNLLKTYSLLRTKHSF
jgi:hypothetical protein